MKIQDLPYAGILSFTVRIPSEKMRMLQGWVLMDFTLTGDAMFLYPLAGKTGDKSIVSGIQAEIVASKEIVLEHLAAAKGRSILRLESSSTSDDTVYLSLLEYKQFRYNLEPLTIVIDDAITPQLHRLDIIKDEKDAVNQFTRDIICKTKTLSVCFAIGVDQLTFVGSRWMLSCKMSSAGYVHVTDISRHPQDAASGQIELILGCPSDEHEFAPVRFCLRKELEHELQEKSNAIYQQMVALDNNELLQLWEAYNKCELIVAKNAAKAIGYLSYKSLRPEGRHLVFSLLPPETLTADFAEPGIMLDAIASSDDAFGEESVRSVMIGEVSEGNRQGSNELIVNMDETIPVSGIPGHGKLYVSIRGTKTQTERRTKARDMIRSGRCALPDLRLLIQSGAVVGQERKHRAAVTKALERTIFHGNPEAHFNDSQRAAIEAALNTPDVAVIQGPPGTGKTQVIRAIVERIQEEEKGEARILISSTQHDAVDNAISGILYNGVPANRVVDRRHVDRTISPIYEWIDAMSAQCQKWLDAHRQTDYSSLLQCARLALNHDGKSEAEWADGLSQLYQELSGIHISIAVLEQLRQIMQSTSSGVGDSESAELDRFISAVPTEEMDFLAYGADHLKTLANYLKYDIGHPEWVPSYWRTLAREKTGGEALKEQLQTLHADLLRIRKQYGCDEDYSVDNRESIDRFLHDLALEVLRMQQIPDMERERMELIRTFMYELSNSYHVENLIRTYSQLNASTNQQSVSRSLFGTLRDFQGHYDYVIIDEAARSNPLDLMIPMVMGNRIIFVGDQKQLPPMLDPEVVGEVVAQQKENDPDYATLLKESLFERLFRRMKEQDDRAGAHVRRVVTLDTQFRMHPMISDLVSDLFYRDSGGLKSGCTAADKTLRLGLYHDKPLAWLDMPATVRFSEESSGKSKYRDCEVQQVYHELQQIEHRSPDSSIGIITFYRDQMTRIQQIVESQFPDQLHHIQVGTVDAFQGKEFDIVILSTVRCNRMRDDRQHVGFLADSNRLCVAFSRARKLLLIIGDAKTVTTIDAFKKVLAICKEGGGYYENLGY